MVAITERGSRWPSVAQSMARLSTPEPNSGCLLWAGNVRLKRRKNGWVEGYGDISIGRKRVAAHRVAWMLARGPIPSGLLVCHRCNVKQCVNPDHLYLATNEQNIADATRDMLKAKKLTPADVLEIRASAKAGELQRVVAARYGINRSTVSEIVSGRKWGHL